jgi:hypothetical protein
MEKIDCGLNNIKFYLVVHILIEIWQKQLKDFTYAEKCARARARTHTHTHTHTQVWIAPLCTRQDAHSASILCGYDGL